MYLYFLVHISQDRHRFELTGPERFVLDKVWPEKGRRDHQWLPRERTLSLKHHVDEMQEDEQVLSTGLNDLCETVAKGCDVMDTFEVRLELLQARLLRSRMRRSNKTESFGD